jgi:hypothetical protein
MPSVSSGQVMSRLSVAVHAEPTSRAAKPDLDIMLRVDSAGAKRSHPILRGAGIGALVGVAAGLAYAMYIDANNTCNLPRGVGCIDDERALAYIVFPMYGVTFGAVAGGVVGAVRR